MVKALKKVWADFDLTMEEGLQSLNRLCIMEMAIKGGDSLWRLPEPDPQTRKLLEVLKINLPPAFPK